MGRHSQERAATAKVHEPTVIKFVRGLAEKIVADAALPERLVLVNSSSGSSEIMYDTPTMGLLPCSMLPMSFARPSFAHICQRAGCASQPHLCGTASLLECGHVVDMECSNRRATASASIERRTCGHVAHSAVSIARDWVRVCERCNLRCDEPLYTISKLPSDARRGASSSASAQFDDCCHVIHISCRPSDNLCRTCHVIAESVVVDIAKQAEAFFHEPLDLTEKLTSAGRGSGGA